MNSKSSLNGLMIAIILLITAVISFFVTMKLLPFVTMKLLLGKSDPVKNKTISKSFELHGYAATSLNTCFDSKPAAQCKSEVENLINSIGYSKNEYFETVIRSDFNIYIVEKNLILFKKACTPADMVHDVFVANFWPLRNADLSEKRKKYEFEVIGFPTKKRGLRIGSNCVAAQTLPNTLIRQLLAGQYNRKGSDKGFIWKEMIKF